MPESSSTMSMPVAIGSQSTQIPSGAISPLMSPIRNATVNGLNLLVGNTVQGTAVRLSWSVPTGIPAFGYVISLYRSRTSSTGTQYYEGPIATLCAGETWSLYHLIFLRLEPVTFSGSRQELTAGQTWNQLLSVRLTQSLMPILFRHPYHSNEIGLNTKGNCQSQSLLFSRSDLCSSQWSR